MTMMMMMSPHYAPLNSVYTNRSLPHDLKSPIILIPRRIIHLPKNKIIDTCHSIAKGVEHALQISLPINVELISVSDKV